AGWHPVARYGQAMLALETRVYADRRSRGVAYAATGVAAAWLAGRAMQPSRTESRRGRPMELAAVVLATYVAVAGKALAAAATDVAGPLAGGDLATSRERLPSLVGRDPSGLDAAGISRAVVESVAENTVDAVVAPAFWAALAGPPGVLAYRAVNTLDAMVGHRSLRYRRFGWASARADDVAAWVPARLTALLVALARPASARRVWVAVRTQAPTHPSPNAGVAEAAFAAALGLRLGGTNTYGSRTEHRPTLGAGRPADIADIDRAGVLSRDVTVALGLILLGPTLVALVRNVRDARDAGNAHGSRRSRRRPKAPSIVATPSL
ncbi:MAG TPA: adenosylcobinamide-phosphate synthase CbiB, partial [Acidimicrobiales bacterium]|nr:adenosylcobinamide-phosphate synthase CbiB [Acidimicrobiales bacterium]